MKTTDDPPLTYHESITLIEGAEDAYFEACDKGDDALIGLCLAHLTAHKQRHIRQHGPLVRHEGVWS
jgi:hypothetical protein